MPAPSTPRVSVSAPILAALCGALLGLASVAIPAALWRTGAPRLAAVTAEGSLLLALTCLAGFTLLARPARPRRVRVLARTQVRRALETPEIDPVPVLAICAGVPLVAGAAAAVLLFH